MFTIPIFDYVGSPMLVFIFGLMLLLQWWYPLRRQHFSSLHRVIRNISLALPTFVMLRLLLLPVPLLVALWAEEHGVGLINWLFPESGPGVWLGRVLGFLAFDYAYYGWHYATHRVNFLFRFHNVHHTDLDMDVSTAIRFHAGELLLSVFFRVAVVLILGIGFWVAIAYELFFEAAAQFHHANLRLPKKVERVINLIFVTPRMHGIHHSIVLDEFNSNWGTLFSFWDRLHGTHRMDISEDELTLGVPAYRNEDELTIGKLLTMPFRPQRDWILPDGEAPLTRKRSEKSGIGNK